jgi:hypothetical protein
VFYYIFSIVKLTFNQDKKNCLKLHQAEKISFGIRNEKDLEKFDIIEVA